MSFSRFSTIIIHIKSISTTWLQQTQTAYLCALKNSHEFTARFENLKRLRCVSVCQKLWHRCVSPQSRSKCFQRLFDASLFVWNLRLTHVDLLGGIQMELQMKYWIHPNTLVLGSRWIWQWLLSADADQGKLSRHTSHFGLKEPWLRPPLEERLREEAQQLEVQTELLHLQLFWEYALCFIGYDDINKSSQFGGVSVGGEAVLEATYQFSSFNKLLSAKW